MPREILLLSADLAVQSKVAGASARVGDTLATVANVDLIRESAKAPRPDSVIIDLAMPGLDVGRAVAELRDAAGPATFIIAFGPHVHEALLQSARDAGCDLVLPRGQFYAQLDGILATAPDKA